MKVLVHLEEDVVLGFKEEMTNLENGMLSAM